MAEHPFDAIKRLWGFAKVRSCGLAKNTVHVFAHSMMANLFRFGTGWCRVIRRIGANAKFGRTGPLPPQKRGVDSGTNDRAGEDPRSLKRHRPAPRTIPA